METSIAHSEACKLSRVPIRVLAARNCGLDQAMLQQLLVEVASVAAEVSNQIANFGSDASVLMADQSVQVQVNVCVVDRLIKLFRDPGKLADQAERVHDQARWVLCGKQSILRHCCQAASIDELLGEITRFLRSEDQL